MATPRMAGLLMEGEWTPEIKGLADGATSLSRVVLDAREYLFPGGHLSRFHLPLAKPNDLEEAIRADLALIANNLNAWYLLFVAPSGSVDLDSLIAKLESAKLVTLGDRAARYLSRKIDELEDQEAHFLVREVPGLVVVTDNPSHGWCERFSAARVEVEVVVVEQFRAAEGYVIRLNGKTPVQDDADVIGICEEHPTLSTCLLVTWKESTTEPSEGDVTLIYKDSVTNWELRQGDLNWQLHATGTFPLLEPPPYEIVEDPTGTRFIRNLSNQLEGG